jgi:hypothetical protein
MPKQQDKKPLDTNALKAAARKAGFADVIACEAGTLSKVVFTGYTGKGDMFAAVAGILKESDAATDYNMRSIDTAEGRCVVARIANPVDADKPAEAPAAPAPATRNQEPATRNA